MDSKPEGELPILTVTERELAAQTLADFERDGFGHWLDNADADVLRAMVRLSVDRHRGAVRENERLRDLLRRIRSASENSMMDTPDSAHALEALITDALGDAALEPPGIPPKTEHGPWWLMVGLDGKAIRLVEKGATVAGIYNAVEVVPAAQLAGAVAEDERLRDLLGEAAAALTPLEHPLVPALRAAARGQ